MYANGGCIELETSKMIGGWDTRITDEVYCDEVSEKEFILAKIGGRDACITVAKLFLINHKG